METRVEVVSPDVDVGADVVVVEASSVVVVVVTVPAEGVVLPDTDIGNSSML